MKLVGVGFGQPPAESFVLVSRNTLAPSAPAPLVHVTVTLVPLTVAFTPVGTAGGVPAAPAAVVTPAAALTMTVAKSMVPSARHLGACFLRVVGNLRTLLMSELPSRV